MFLDTAETATALLRNPILAEQWATPSALPEFSTGGLARHLANQVTQTVTLLAGPPGESVISVLEHFTSNAWMTSGVGSADNIDIRRRSEQAAAATTASDLGGRR